MVDITLILKKPCDHCLFLQIQQYNSFKQDFLCFFWISSSYKHYLYKNQFMKARKTIVSTTNRSKNTTISKAFWVCLTFLAFSIYKLSNFITYKPIPLFKEHVLVGNALDWQKFNWHKSHRRNGYPQLTQKDSTQHTLLFSFVSMSTHKLEFPLQFVPLASISINHLLAKRPVLN